MQKVSGGSTVATVATEGSNIERILVASTVEARYSTTKSHHR
jgi:hypothetical protein